MPKYLLRKHYRGGPEPHRPVPPMDQWAPEDVEAHMAFLRHVGELPAAATAYAEAARLATDIAERYHLIRQAARARAARSRPRQRRRLRM